MNIQEIKKLTKDKQPYFFSSGAMKFFGQQLNSFRVKESPSGRVFIYAPSRTDGRLMGYTFREYKDGDLLDVDIETSGDSKGRILDYIQTH